MEAKRKEEWKTEKMKERDGSKEKGSEILPVHAIPTNELTMDNGGPHWKNKGKRDVERREGALITKGAPGVFVDKGTYMQMAVRRQARRKEKVSLSCLLSPSLPLSLSLSLSVFRCSFSRRRNNALRQYATRRGWDGGDEMGYGGGGIEGYNVS
jgi:hypothetical protein